MANRRLLLDGMYLWLAVLITGCASETPAIAEKTPPSPPIQVAQAMPEKTLDRAIESLAQQIATSLPAEKKPLTAVLDFNDLSGCVSSFGRLVGEELVTKLFQTRRVRVVERGLLEKAVNELKFNLSELVDPSRAKQLGKQVGADAIVTGTITDLGSAVKVNARLIEVERGDILAAAGAEVTKDGVVARLINQSLNCPGKERKEPTKVVEETPASPPASKPAPAQAAMKVEANNFEFVLQGCQKGGTQVTCSLLATNLSDDREIRVSGAGCMGASSLYDANGNVFQASEITVGNNRRGCSASLKLVSGIPTRVVLHFDNVKTSADAIALLEVGFDASPRWMQFFSAQLRNIPLSQ